MDFLRQFFNEDELRFMKIVGGVAVGVVIFVIVL